MPGRIRSYRVGGVGDVAISKRELPEMMRDGNERGAQRAEFGAAFCIFIPSKIRQDGKL